MIVRPVLVLNNVGYSESSDWCVALQIIYLLIDNVARQVNGEWRTEIVRDAAVINAYVKKRQVIEEENTTADALAPTGDAERDRRAMKR